MGNSKAVTSDYREWNSSKQGATILRLCCWWTHVNPIFIDCLSISVPLFSTISDECNPPARDNYRSIP